MSELHKGDIIESEINDLLKRIYQDLSLHSLRLDADSERALRANLWDLYTGAGYKP